MNKEQLSTPEERDASFRACYLYRYMGDIGDTGNKEANAKLEEIGKLAKELRCILQGTTL